MKQQLHYNPKRWIMLDKIELEERERFISSTADLRVALSGLDLLHASTAVGMSVGLSPAIDIRTESAYTAEQQWDIRHDRDARAALRKLQIGVPISVEIAVKVAKEVWIRRNTVSIYDLLWFMENGSVVSSMCEEFYENYTLITAVCENIVEATNGEKFFPKTLDHGVLETAIDDAREEHGGDLTGSELRKVIFKVHRYTQVFLNWQAQHNLSEEECFQLCVNAFSRVVLPKREWLLDGLPNVDNLARKVYKLGGQIKWQM